MDCNIDYIFQHEQRIGLLDVVHQRLDARSMDEIPWRVLARWLACSMSDEEWNNTFNRLDILTDIIANDSQLTKRIGAVNKSPTSAQK